MFGKKAAYMVSVLILVTIHKLHGTHFCTVFRNGRDNITLLNCTTPVKDVCKSLGADVKNAKSCKCICPRDEGTYMETTQKCTAKSNVWPGCNVKLKGPPWFIPVFRPRMSEAALIIVPTKFKGCKLSIDKRKSFYLDINGWKRIHSTKGFPFKLYYDNRRLPFRSGKKGPQRKDNLFLKWNRLDKANNIIRLQVKGCKKIKSDCLLFKVGGRSQLSCTLAKPTTAAITTTASATISKIIPFITRPSQKVNMTTPSQKLSVAGKGKQESSNSKDHPWAITGSIIGVIAVLIVCIIVLVLWFCRWKKKLKEDYNSSAASSAFILNSTPSSSREVTYAAPRHPYQDLKPPVRGAPPRVYQSVDMKAKEDASGYLLPVLPDPESSRDPEHEPIYNEIRSPMSPLTYDYALPEDTVRFSIHSLNGNISNDPAYVGRPSKEQEGPNPNGDSKPAYTEPVQNSPPEEIGEPGYLDLNAPNDLGPGRQTKANTYQEPSPVRPRGHNQAGPSGVGQGAPSMSGPYQALLPPSGPRYEPLRISRQGLNSVDSTTA